MTLARLKKGSCPRTDFCSLATCTT